MSHMSTTSRKRKPTIGGFSPNFFPHSEGICSGLVRKLRSRRHCGEALINWKGMELLLDCTCSSLEGRLSPQLSCRPSHPYLTNYSTLKTCPLYQRPDWQGECLIKKNRDNCGLALSRMSFGRLPCLACKTLIKRRSLKALHYGTQIKSPHGGYSEVCILFLPPKAMIRSLFIYILPCQRE
jgi:hypothetical protein